MIISQWASGDCIFITVLLTTNNYMQETFCWTSPSWKTRVFSGDRLKSFQVRLCCARILQTKYERLMCFCAYWSCLQTNLLFEPFFSCPLNSLRQQWLHLQVSLSWLMAKMKGQPLHYPLGHFAASYPFFHLCICLMLNCSGYMWSWRSSSSQGWAPAVPAADLWFGCESTSELVTTRQQSQSQVLEEGPFLQAGFFRHWKPLIHLTKRGFWCFLEIIWQNNHL